MPQFFPKTSSEGLKLRNKELEIKLGQLQEETSKASLPVSADLCNNFQLIIWKLTKERFTFREFNFGVAVKTSSLLSIMLHITPSTLTLMLHIRQSIYLVLLNVLSASFLIVHMTFDEISLQFQSTIILLHMCRVHLSLSELYRHFCTILVKIDLLYTCGAICSYFKIVFLLLVTRFENSMLLFINEFIFDIMNIQNNHFLEFE